MKVEICELARESPSLTESQFFEVVAKLLQTLALELARDASCSTEGFTASKCWLHRYKQRHHVVKYTARGEAQTSKIALARSVLPKLSSEAGYSWTTSRSSTRRAASMQTKAGSPCAPRGSQVSKGQRSESQSVCASMRVVRISWHRWYLNCRQDSGALDQTGTPNLSESTTPQTRPYPYCGTVALRRGQ